MEEASGGTEEGETEGGTAEQRCPICLEQYDDKAFIDPCFHCFCFQCIVQWSEVTTTCPMCKTRFTTLIHNVEAIDKYAQYKVQPKVKSFSLEISIGEARRFRYRTTRVPGQPRPSSAQSPSHGQERERESSIEREQRERRERERRRRRREAAQQMSNPASDERRRVVYALGLWAQPAHTERGKKERVREITATFFQQNPACTHRLVPWLTREFRVLLGPTHVQFMIQLVLSLVDKINVDSEEFSEHLQPFLLTRTPHFLHELISFARSPLNMAAYDSSVRYEWPTGRPRDDWDPEATVNSLPQQLQDSPSSVQGPSGLTSQEIQERLFHELTSTRWDDSPPSLPHSPSSSPILIHGSDSETEEGEQRTGNEFQTESNQEATPPHMTTEVSVSGIDGEVHAVVTSQSASDPVTDSAINTRSKREAKERESGLVDNEESVIASSPVVSNQQLSLSATATENQSVGSSKDTIKAPNASLVNSELACLMSTNVVAGSSTLGSSHLMLPREEQETHEEEREEREEGGEREECIVINAESENEEQAGHKSSETFGEVAAYDLDRWQQETRQHDKSSTEQKKTEKLQKESSRERAHQKKYRDRSEDERMRSRKGKDRERHRSRKHSSTSRRRHRRSGERESKHYGRHYSSSESPSDTEYASRHRTRRKISRSPAWRRHRDAEIEPYYVREKHHRSRLYSDDYSGARASSLSSGKWRSDERQRRRDERERRESERGSRRSHRRGRSRERNDGGVAGQKLQAELASIDEEIVRHKREVLKAMLRSERLKLLHRQLQGRDLPDDNYNESVGEPPAIDETMPTGEVVRQLAELDRAIVDEKRRVLQVMKRIEEDKADADT